MVLGSEMAMRDAECRLLRSDAAVSVGEQLQVGLCLKRLQVCGLIGEDGLEGQWSLVRED